MIGNPDAEATVIPDDHAVETVDVVLVAQTPHQASEMQKDQMKRDEALLTIDQEASPPPLFVVDERAEKILWHVSRTAGQRELFDHSANESLSR